MFSRSPSSGARCPAPAVGFECAARRDSRQAAAAGDAAVKAAEAGAAGIRREEVRAAQVQSAEAAVCKAVAWWCVQAKSVADAARDTAASPRLLTFLCI